MVQTTSFPPGALSLLYHLANTEDVRARFKADPSSVLHEFALSPQAQQAIKTAGDDLTPENCAAVLAFVQSEIEQRRELMW
ncbi:hypothetical protein BE21_56095 [Sorangium cellulosum]|uniref:Uncharacterized protein n=1 Tax=Sorangium cellulosum TaxID=56 RepID=A0A150TAW7_SORCE|nr:hypothetical protein BE21_56095 [Sorangium cellulosum]